MLLVQAQARARKLYMEVEYRKESLRDTTLPEYARTQFDPVANYRLAHHSTLKLHQDKVAGISWGQLTKLLLCSTDGFMFLWDSVTGYKHSAVKMELSWMLTCALSPGEDIAVAGGLDNTALVYRLREGEVTQYSDTQLRGHRQYISGCGFMDRLTLVTLSGDRMCVVWDVSRGLATTTFDHTHDVLCVDVRDAHTFILGSLDGTINVWDARVPQPVQLFISRKLGDVLCLKLYGSSLLFVCGTEDGALRIYDSRSDCSIATLPFDASSYKNIAKMDATVLAGSIMLVDVLVGYRMIYATYKGINHAVVWDTMRGEIVGQVGNNKSQVAQVKVAPMGMALATSLWDGSLRVYLV